MRRPDPGLLVLLPLLAFAIVRPSRSRAAEPASRPAYPPTRTTPTSEVLHGVTVRDPYRWLEDGKSPEVQAWMNAEDAFARKELAELPGRDALAARLKELLYVDTSRRADPPRHALLLLPPPREPGEAVVYWKEGKDGAEQVLLDPNAWSTDGSAGLGAWSVSWDGKKRRLRQEGQQLGRGDPPRHGRRDRQGLRRRRHRGRQVRGAPRGRRTATASTTRGCPSTRGSRRPSAPAARRSASTGSGPTRRPTPSCTRSPATRRRSRTRDHARRALALPHRRARLDVDGRVVPRPREGRRRHELDPPRRRGSRRTSTSTPSGARSTSRRTTAPREGGSSPSIPRGPRARRGRRSSPSAPTRRSRASASSAGGSRSIT